MKNLRIYLIVSLVAPSLVFAQAQPPAPTTSHVSNVENIVAQAANKSETLKSLKASLESLESEIKARDLELSSRLSAELSAYTDKREVFGTIPREGTSGVFGLTVVKPFSSGTELLVATDHTLLGKDDTYPERNTAQWQVQLSQSLWQNSFGRSTRLRHQAEEAELKSRKASLEFERQNFLIRVENAYWDLVLVEKELAIRKDNVKRSQTLEAWTSRRMRQFAAEKTDLLQVQALLAQRKLDLAIVENDLTNKQKNLEQLVPGLEYKSTDFVAEKMGDVKSNYTEQFKNKKLRLDAYAQEQRAQQNSFEALRDEDSLSPDLSVFASYTQNGIAEKFDPAWDRAIEENHSEQKVGLTLTLLLDSEGKSQQQKASAKASEAAKYRAQALNRESENSWDELARNFENIGEQIKIAKNLFDIQSQKLKAEQQRFQQGRTTTLQMTTFEIDAAESELRLYRLLSQQQKLASQFRLFVSAGSDL
ncbi:MAG: TolC family protein [Pseudobdellovibrio sp.]|nr:TolC family protein [Pseudobdellovibrio sp.]